MISHLPHANHVKPKCTLCLQPITENRIGGVIVNVFPSSAVNCGFEPQKGQTQNYKNVYVLLLR